MAGPGASDLEELLAEFGVDTEFWEQFKRPRLTDEFNELSAQGVHCRFWPGRESGCQLDADWESEVASRELPEPLPEVARALLAIESTELTSLERFVAVPIGVADAWSRYGRGIAPHGSRRGDSQRNDE